MTVHRHDDSLLDQSDLADHLKVNRKTVSRMIAEGRLPKPVKYGGLQRWRWGAVRDWMKAMEVLDQLKHQRNSAGQQGANADSEGTNGPTGDLSPSEKKKRS